MITKTSIVIVGEALVLALPNGSVFDTVVTSENLTQGQLIAAYTLSLCKNASATSCTRLRALGGTVGNKVIDSVGLQNVTGASTTLQFVPTKVVLPTYAKVSVSHFAVYRVAVPMS
eukprot:m.235510 g.235510  ORF g.235510 m.235510 type:complete len:116 (-) comp33664_c12_seq2:205-552(-)